MEPQKVDESELVARAFRAYFASCRKEGVIEMQPSMLQSGLREHNRHNYIVLENCNGPLAVYRVRNDGKLKALKRWPAVFSQEISE